MKDSPEEAQMIKGEFFACAVGRMGADCVSFVEKLCMLGRLLRRILLRG